MQSPMKVTFHDVDPSDAVHDYIRKKVAKIDAHYPRVTSCRIAVEAPHRSHAHGKRYRVRVDLSVPGRELVAGTGPHDDVYAAIDDAFDDAQRLLHDHTERQREAQTKAH